jgi:hypothetical protein
MHTESQKRGEMGMLMVIVQAAHSFSRIVINLPGASVLCSSDSSHSNRSLLSDIHISCTSTILVVAFVLLVFTCIEFGFAGPLVEVVRIGERLKPC